MRVGEYYIMDNLVRDDIKELQTKTASTYTDLKILESRSEDRHKVLLEKIENINNDVQKMSVRLDSELSRIITKMDDLNDLANQGKTSLKTLWFIGGLAASILAFLATWADLFK